MIAIHRFASCVTIALVVVSTSIVAPPPARADWLFYRGPTENGIAPDIAWSPVFPAEGPKVLWKAELGTGLSSVTISAGHLFSMGNKTDKDSVYCLDAGTGKEVWHSDFPVKLDANMFEGGPRSTPTLDGKHVFTVTHEGDLSCLDAATGKRLWSHQYQKEYGGRRPQWGYAGSPLVTGALVICDVGGSGASTIAFDKETGAVVWKNGGDQPGYASPVAANIGGHLTAIVLKSDALVGYNIKDGKELWRTSWKTEYDVNAATPLVIDGDRVFVSSGYNAGCALFRIENGSATLLWRNKNLRSHINSPLSLQGCVFGMDGNANGGNLVCLDLATGDRKWEEKSVKGGSLIAASGKLIVLSERGDLVICDASPAGFHPVSRAHILGKRCWVQPVLDGGKLFVKNNEGQLECLSLAPR